MTPNISGKQVWVAPAEGGTPRTVLGISNGELAVGWSGDSHALLTYPSRGLPRKFFRTDIAIGRREVVKQFAPADTAGIEYLGPIVVTPDARFYSYGFIRNHNDMYSIVGLKWSRPTMRLTGLLQRRLLRGGWSAIPK